MIPIIDGLTFQAETVIPYPNGGRVDISEVRGKLAFDQVIDGLWQVCICDLDGTNIQVLTASQPELPVAGHRGNPAWSEDGNWIVFQACTLQAQLVYPGLGAPGLGLGNDGYILHVDSGLVWKLTNIVSPREGVLHLNWGPGGRLWWSQKESGYEDGRWFIGAGIVTFPGGVPVLSDVSYYKPRGDGLYEPHDMITGFALLTISSLGTSQEPGLALWRVSSADFTTSPVRVESSLNTDLNWYEHGHFSIGGTHVFFMTSRGTGVVDPFGPNLRTDLARIPMASITGTADLLTDLDNPAHPTYRPDVPQPIIGDFAVTEFAVYAYVLNGSVTLSELEGTTFREGEIIKITAVT